MLLENKDNIAYTKGAISHYSKTYLNVPVLALPTFATKVSPMLAQLSGTPKAPTPFEIEDVHKRLSYAVKHKKYDVVLAKDWQFAPYVFWFGNDKLGADLGFLRGYLLWLERHGTPRDWRRLIHIYLRDYDHQSSNQESFAIQNAAIREAINSTQHKDRLIKWHTREMQYSLFSTHPKFNVIVNEFIDCKNDWRLFSERTGLEGELAQVGFSIAVGDQLLMRLIDSPSVELIEAAKNYHMHDDKLRFPQRKTHLIEALISPWLSSKQLGEPIQKSVRDWLLKHFNDPRLTKHDRVHWHAVRSEYKKVMLRWLIGETLNQFFEVIDQVAKDSHWKYRKAFWRSYFDKGYLDEAWVALGPIAKSHAQKAFGDKVSVGNLKGSIQQNHSVLIVRIDNLVLADWSHDGKCRAWRVDDEDYCPKNYQDEYSGYVFKKPSMKIVKNRSDDGITHWPCENYWWQERLSEFIYNETGLRVYQRDFRI